MCKCCLGKTKREAVSLRARPKAGFGEGAVEQGDEADEAFGGTRLVPRIPG